MRLFGTSRRKGWKRKVLNLNLLRLCSTRPSFFNLPEKLERQKELRKLETKRDEAWHSYDQASREIDRRKDALLDEISHRLEQKTERETLFTLRWRVV